MIGITKRGSRSECQGKGQRHTNAEIFTQNYTCSSSFLSNVYAR